MNKPDKDLTGSEITKKVAATANKDKETIEKDLSEFFGAKVCAEVGLTVAKQCSQNMLYILAKHPIKGSQSFKGELNRIKSFCHSASGTMARFGMKKLDTVSEIDAERSMLSANTLSAANFIDLYFAAAAIHPEDIDLFCEEANTLSRRFMERRMAAITDFWEWLCAQGWQYDHARYWLPETEWQITLRVLDGKDAICVQHGTSQRLLCAVPTIEQAIAIFQMLKIKVI